MNKKILILILLLISCSCFAQHNTINKEEELRKFVKQGGKVEETATNIYKLTHPDGMSRIYNFNPELNATVNNTPIDTTIINIGEIDTTRFNNMFTYWQTVAVSNMWFSPVIVDDVNANALPEIYGFSDHISSGPPPWVGPVKIYERNLSGIYQNVFTFDSLSMYVNAVGDIRGNGSKDLVIRSLLANYGAVFYKPDSLGALPTTFDFIFYFPPTQINTMIFGDLDNNNNTDCAFVILGSEFYISEYREDINNFETVFHFLSNDQNDLSGFAINDFNKNGLVELVVSSGGGNVYIIENKGVNEYSVINRFPFPYLNAYMQTTTNDIDGNGKLEFWIGGQSFTQGITMYQCYEYDGDSSYQPVARIELRYSLSITTNYIQAVDIDGDGKEELIISSGNIILILKFIGSPGNHQYELWYAKLGEATQPLAEIYPVAISDLDGDGKKDLLVPFNKYEEPYILAFSYILRRDTVTGILPEWDKSIQEINITSHPNPFNSTSTINIQLNKTSDVQLKIYNALGEEINLLLDKELSPGEYNIPWDAKDKSGNSLPSGIYLIALKTKNSIKTIKTILIK